MTSVQTAPVTTRRPRPVVALIALLLMLGITALAGGIAMVFGVGGESMLPEAWLDGIPLIDSWVIPGLVLGLGFGVGSLVVAYGVIRRPELHWLDWVESRTGHHWSWAGALVIGAGQVVWILLELAFLPEATWLHAVYGSVGLGLVVLPLLPTVRDHLVVASGRSTKPKAPVAP